MFRKIIELSTVYKWFTLAIAVIVSGIGIYSALRMDVDVLPNINKPTVAVFAEADGLAPEEVEKLVLTPLENGANN